MSEIQSILSIILVVSGIFLMLTGSIGIIRLPDFYSRTHATSKSDTLGILLAMLGLIVYEGWELNSLKLILIALFIALSNPIGAHALARSAYLTGLKPFLTRKKPNEETNS